jgi:uncharacterized ferredoxin-like protein
VTPRGPKPSTRSCSSDLCRAGTHRATTAAPAGTSANLEYASPVCNLRDIDLDVAVRSAAKTATLHSIDCRCESSVGTAARKLGLILAEHAVALSLLMTHKAIGFDVEYLRFKTRPSNGPAPGAADRRASRQPP